MTPIIGDNLHGFVRRTDVIVPRLTLYLRAQKSRRRLHGLGAPGSFLRDLVPAGGVVVDAGANRGLYSYWLSRKAAHVYAFEPNPQLFRYLRRSCPRNVTPVNVALSNVNGQATLYVPRSLDGEGSIEKRQEDAVMFSVATERLDDLGLPPVDSMKIDVEGHELELIEGAHECILRDRPWIFIELEERHRSGSTRRVPQLLRDEFGYTQAFYMRFGRLHPMVNFHPATHQNLHNQSPSSPGYVSNFLFLP